MSLRSHTIKDEYRSLIDNVVQDFYVPLLSEAVSYKRAVGFFSSSALVELSKGISDITERGGKIQMVASPHLSEEDVEAIRKGYEVRDVIEASLLRGIEYEDKDHYSLERLNLLANLIADGVLDIRIAYTENNDGIGMYHEKMGIIQDAEGNRVAFSGSMNESKTAMLDNYETIDVFCDWKSDDGKRRVATKEAAFASIWADTEPNIKVLEFPKVTDEFIKRYKTSVANHSIDKQQFPEVQKTKRITKEVMTIGARVPKDIDLRDYQKSAIASWVGENYCGIFDMATGTGKTYTGLGAIAKLSEDLNDKLAVIIVCPYQHLVDQWVEDIVRFNISPIIAYSSSPQRDWKTRLSKAVRDQRLRKEKSFFCLVCTNATFKSDYVQEQINKTKSEILLVVDEAHNFGAQSYSQLLDDRFSYRLALSATLERHGDEEGTNALYDFFGRKCIEYDLERAINEDKLTPYKYYPIVVHLTDEELQKYTDLSLEISKCLVKGKNGKYRLNKRGENLAMKRARVVAGAQEKLDALRQVIEPYREDNNILVYCGATNVINESSDCTETASDDIRQIEAVVKILGIELQMNVSKFTSDENTEQRAAIKNHFLDGSLQGIVAIKCLDEGVNIPGIRTAFILASTTNPKEYIQRRGRVLRKAKGKNYAEIFDFVTLPRPLDSVAGLTREQASREKSLARNEVERIREFGRLAMNSMESNNLIWEIEEVYHLNDNADAGEERENNE